MGVVTYRGAKRYAGEVCPRCGTSLRYDTSEPLRYLTPDEYVGFGWVENLAEFEYFAACTSKTCGWREIVDTFRAYIRNQV